MMGGSILVPYPIGARLETTMTPFRVDGMTCGCCAGTITRALKNVDAAARVEISLRDKLVKVESRLAADEIAAAIREAGYSPERA
jgi:copper chaperone